MCTVVFLFNHKTCLSVSHFTLRTCSRGNPVCLLLSLTCKRPDLYFQAPIKGGGTATKLSKTPKKLAWLGQESNGTGYEATIVAFVFAMLINHTHSRL